MNTTDLRRRFPVLTRHFSDEDCRVLLATLAPARFPPGARLATYGEAADTLHLITQGSVSIHAEQDAENLLLGQAIPGCVVGEVGLLEPGPASATMEALETVESLTLSHEDFERLCGEAPATASALVRALSVELVQRLRNSSRDILRRVDDHQWMRLRAKEDPQGWLARIASLVRGTAGGEA